MHIFFKQKWHVTLWLLCQGPDALPLPDPGHFSSLVQDLFLLVLLSSNSVVPSLMLMSVHDY